MKIHKQLLLLGFLMLLVAFICYAPDPYDTIAYGIFGLINGMMVARLR